MRCWESPGDLPLLIEIVVSSRSFRCAPLVKRHKFLSLVEDHPVFPKNVCKNLLISPGTLASSTIKTGRHDIAEILLKVTLDTKIKSVRINQNLSDDK